MVEISKLMSGDFDVVRFSKKAVRKVFGRHAWLDAVIELDFVGYLETAQAWGLDLPLINRLFVYTKSSALHFTSHLLSMVGLLLSFGSWIISLGLDFMVFAASLFYLLVESDELLNTMKDIASVIPSESPANEQQRRLSILSGFSISSLDSLNAHFGGDSKVANEPHFLLSLFKSIQDLFVVTFEIFVTHAFVTWLSFTLFRYSNLFRV